MKKQKLAEEVKLPEEAKPSEADAFLEAYKVQNPVKYEAKKSAGEFKHLAIIVFAIMIGVVGVFGGVKAYQNYNDSPKVVVEGDYIEAAQPTPIISDSDEKLGAVVSAEHMESLVCSNDSCTYTAKATFIDASTTILSIVDPFLQASSSATNVIVKTDGSGEGIVEWTGATSTVELTRLYITGPATSSYNITCGATSTPALTGTVTTSLVSILDSGLITTSTAGVVENNIIAGGGALVSGGSTAKIMLTPQTPYFICGVTSATGDIGAFTGTGNTFDGYGVIRVSRLRF